MNRSADTRLALVPVSAGWVADVGNEPIGGHFTAAIGLRPLKVADVGNEPIGGHSNGPRTAAISTGC